MYTQRDSIASSPTWPEIPHPDPPFTRERLVVHELIDERRVLKAARQHAQATSGRRDQPDPGPLGPAHKMFGDTTAPEPQTMVPNMSPAPPRPSPRRWLRSQVASAAARLSGCCPWRQQTSGILPFLSRLSPSERSPSYVVSTKSRDLRPRQRRLSKRPPFRRWSGEPTQCPRRGSSLPHHG